MANKSNNERSKNFIFILYPGSEFYNENLEKIKQCKYAYIVHDKDKWTEDKVNGTHKEYCEEHNIKVGDPVKEHCHAIVMFDSQRWRSAVCNQFIHIPKNDIQVCHNLRGSIRYLIHADNQDKAQYDLTQIKSNEMQLIEKQFLDKVDSDNIANLIINFVNDNIGYVDEVDVMKYLQSLGHPSYYPRYRSLVLDLLKNHAKQMNYSKEYKNLLNVIRTGFDSLNDKLSSPKDKQQLVELEQTFLDFVNDSYKYRDK